MKILYTVLAVLMLTISTSCPNYFTKTKEFPYGYFEVLSREEYVKDCPNTVVTNGIKFASWQCFSEVIERESNTKSLADKKISF